LQISIERAVPLGAIKFIGTSTCRDDWFSLGIGSPQEADPLLSCVLKTEMFTHMQRAMPGGLSLRIADQIEYAKKPGKMQIVKVLKDAPQPVDFYKSGAVHTQPGEPRGSASRPTPRAKPVPPRPITRGKLIKPGGPGGRPSRVTTNRAAQPRPSASSSRPVRQPRHAAAATRPVPQPAAGATAIASHTRNHSNTGARAPPPPPPAVPPAKPKIMAKVLYDFNGQKQNELSIKEGMLIEIVQKENNGWWLAKHGEQQAWVPAAYVEEQAPAPAGTLRTPPTPPRRPGGAGRAAGGAQPRDSGMSLNGASGSDSSRGNTPTPSLAGSLADALLARQNAMQRREDDDR